MVSSLIRRLNWDYITPQMIIQGKLSLGKAKYNFLVRAVKIEATPERFVYLVRTSLR